MVVCHRASHGQASTFGMDHIWGLGACLTKTISSLIRTMWTSVTH